MAGIKIPISDLPVTIDAYEDDNGYAIVISSDDNRIGGTGGVLTNNFLVRIVRGNVPKTGHAHSVKISDQGMSRSIEAGTAKLDENGRLFVTNKVDGVSRPSAEQDISDPVAKREKANN